MATVEDMIGLRRNLVQLLHLCRDPIPVTEALFSKFDSKRFAKPYRSPLQIRYTTTSAEIARTLQPVVRTSKPEQLPELNAKLSSKFWILLSTFLSFG